VAIQLHDLGGSGEPLLVCHATGFCGRSYEPVARRLQDVFHVWALDFRGHGHSDSPPDGDYSWDRMSEDVKAAQLALSEEGVYVFGHSMGGAAALRAEARWPGTLRAAFVFEPAVSEVRDHAKLAAAMAEQARRRTSVFGSRAEARDRLKQRSAFAGWSADSLDAFVRHGLADRPDGTVILRCSPQSEASCYTSPNSSLEEIAGIDVPVTLASGMADDVFGAALVTRSLSRTIPHAVFSEHDGLSHFGPFEDPDAIAYAIRHALSKGQS
jgi:pimeloyl-ACP methyl ester carboxylesterase